MFCGGSMNSLISAKHFTDLLPDQCVNNATMSYAYNFSTFCIKKTCTWDRSGTRVDPQPGPRDWGRMVPSVYDRRRWSLERNECSADWCFNFELKLSIRWSMLGQCGKPRESCPDTAAQAGLRRLSILQLKIWHKLMSFHSEFCWSITR